MNIFDIILDSLGLILDKFQIEKSLHKACDCSNQGCSAADKSSVC